MTDKDDKGDKLLALTHAIQDMILDAKVFNTGPPEYMKPSGWKGPEPIICTVCGLESEHYPGTLPLNFSPCLRCGTHSWKRQ